MLGETARPEKEKEREREREREGNITTKHSTNRYHKWGVSSAATFLNAALKLGLTPEKTNTQPDSSERLRTAAPWPGQASGFIGAALHGRKPSKTLDCGQIRQSYLCP